MADSPLSPTMQAQLEQLLQLQTDRSARTSPTHQAAMAMAQHMAPGYAQSAMTAPSSLPPAGGGGGSLQGLSSPGGPGLGTTSAALFAAALLKPGSPLLALLKKLAGGGSLPGGVPIPGGEFDPSKVYGEAPDAALPIAGGRAPSGLDDGFKNTDQFWGWGDGNGGRPLGGLFPVQPEDPRHD